MVGEQNFQNLDCLLLYSQLVSKLTLLPAGSTITRWYKLTSPFSAVCVIFFPSGCANFLRDDRRSFEQLPLRLYNAYTTYNPPHQSVMDRLVLMTEKLGTHL